jgi:phosphoglycerate mutase (EC 5.4.2.1)
MDGYGIPKHAVGSAIDAARKPTLDRLFAQYPNITLRAHGTAVGMPSDDDMGNSEVGHNAIGAGQVYAQGAALVANAIAEARSGRARPGSRSSPEPRRARTEKRVCSTSSACSPTATCTATSIT